MTIARVPVGLGARSYEVVIGPGALPAEHAALRTLIGRGRAAILVDAALPQCLPPAAQAVLADWPNIIVPSGEASKSLAEYGRVCDAVLAQGLGRDGTLIGLGGGVVGDLAGFVAATLKRGCRLVQVPTTLLAQVDSSVGGKNGINTAAGKNLLGTFWQPALVIADTALLATLPPREWRAGYAEVVKYGLLGDAAFFSWLETAGADVLAGTEPALSRAVAHACQMKATLVGLDETETGARALLNLGHTFGHALEAHLGYDGRLLHGEAVAIGMAMAARFSATLGLCTETVPDRVSAHLLAAGLPTTPGAVPGGAPTAETFLTLMMQDKKVVSGVLRLILLRGIGEAFIADDVPMPVLRRFLEAEVAS